MAVTSQADELLHPKAHRTPQVLLGGAAVEGIGGVAGIVLSILGLAHIFPAYLTAVAVIVIGAAFVFEGGSIAARYSRLMVATEGDREGRVELGGGATAEFLGGAAGIVLGILALLDIAPATMTAVAALVFGGTLLLGAGTTAKMNAFQARWPGHARVDAIIDDTVNAASGAQVLAGLAVVAMAIVALAGMHVEVLTLAAMLVAGAAQVLSGSAISSKMVEVEEAST